MDNKNVTILLQEMDNIWMKFTICRAFFPYTASDLVGAKGPLKAPYYEQYGHNVYLYSENGLTTDDVARMNGVGHYINQNFIVRLYALLDSYKFSFKKDDIDHAITGWEELEILCLLRNVFAHTSGKYNPDDKKQKILYTRLTTYFKINTIDGDDFPIPIDQVIRPIFDGCKKYVKVFWPKRIGE